jgi:uncharacterized protein DUF3857
VRAGRKLISALAAVTSLAGCGAACAEEWLAATPEELHMTGEPKAARAPAIYLDYQVNRNDQTSEETHYVRIKILTEEGRKYGDVSIRFDENHESISDIEGRTVHPDGSIVKFDGKVYDTPIVKGQGVRSMAKTFTLPDVQVGNIIEYRYRRRNRDLGLVHYVYNSHWILNDQLFIRHGKFTLEPDRHFSLVWSWPQGLPEGSGKPEKRGDMIHLDTRDVPAFVSEEYMPPENALKQRVDFVYSDGASTPTDPEKFWNHYARERYREVNAFIDHRAIASALAQIVAPADSPETKLHKIYARVQRIQNPFWENPGDVEEAQEKLKPIHNAVDVYERGIGDGEQVTWLFLALARAAGFPADPVLVATRDTYFFVPRAMNPGPLNTNLVRVRSADAELYLDPGSPLTPFGLLPWQETGVAGLVITKEGGSWITTPTPPAADSRIEHKAALQLAINGLLKGHVSVTYTGLEAVSHRTDEHHQDAAGRKRDMEDELKSEIPSGCDVELVNQPDWDSSTPTLTAEFELSVPGWITPAGSRGLLPQTLFSAGAKRMFTNSARVQPVYFSYPYRQDDDIVIDLPSGVRVEKLPSAKTVDFGAARYRAGSEPTEHGLHQTRQLSIDGVLIAAKHYDSIYEFFQAVRSQDEQQIILVRTAK